MRKLYFLNAGSAYARDIMNASAYSYKEEDWTRIYSDYQFRQFLQQCFPQAEKTQLEKLFANLSLPVEEVFGPSIFNRSILSLPNDRYFMITPQSVTTLVLQWAIEENYFFDES
jgi:hypothetical protein